MTSGFYCFFNSFIPKVWTFSESNMVNENNQITILPSKKKKCTETRSRLIKQCLNQEYHKQYISQYFYFAMYLVLKVYITLKQSHEEIGWPSIWGIWYIYMNFYINGSGYHLPSYCRYWILFITSFAVYECSAEFMLI